MANEKPEAKTASEAQAFFAELAASLTPPHIDDRYKKSIEELLKRATERGLWSPEKP